MIATLAVMTFSIYGANQNHTASAKAKYVTAFPKSMYGSWYVYTKHKNLNRLIIKKHHIYVSTYKGEKALYTDTWKLRKPFSEKYIDYISANAFNSKKILTNTVQIFHHFKRTIQKNLVINGYSYFKVFIKASLIEMVF